MKRKLACTAMTALFCVATAAPAVASGHGLVFHAELTGDEEVPMPIATDTTGRALLKVNAEGTEIRFDLVIRDAVDILAGPGAHIHCAAFGANGPVVVFLAGGLPVGWDGDVRIRATVNDGNIVNTTCGTTIDELIDSMIAGQTYVNVHSAANPGGEIRGQIEVRSHGGDDDEDGDEGSDSEHRDEDEHGDSD